MYQHVSYESIGAYATSQLPLGEEKNLWILLHGYGQLAPYFLRKFKNQFNEKRLFIAPEAQNHGYLKGYSGRVGANWMTKHERKNAIANNHRFLNQVLARNLERFTDLPSVHILGFSQGCATATRWAAQLSYPIKSLILWGGGFAHDMDFGMVSSKLSETKVWSVEGDSDEFLTDDRKLEQAKILSQMNIKKETIHYSGGHDIYEVPLQKIVHRAESY
ncbi:alpha/beta hydrolase [Echinicola strongylocentroti]|uniref:Alpha/beta hydrolase n=1 Tax=Echinicola strongylocentroti TaxID=1795355 RepID=A0A2Z4IJL5_9BACT|nr:alpha/beta fold hydrolase [Echinicola strongylocentroti]AWW31321.1 alpha/beta hydrolase [Echinicola strongylocentroti]